MVGGTNKVRLTAIGSGGPNVDHLAFNYNNSIQSVQMPVSAESLLPEVAEVLSADVAPNPAKNILNIKPTGLQKNKQLSVSIISSSGIIIQTKQFSSSTQTIRLNLSSLVSGVYTIKLVNGDKVLYKQFVKL